MAKYQEPIDTFANRLYKAMTSRGLAQSDLVKRTGISKGAISQYLSGAYLPKSTNIYLLANILDVSEAFLMGYDVPMDKPKIKTQDYTISIENDAFYLVECYNSLDQEDKQFLISLAEKLKGKK